MKDNLIIILSVLCLFLLGTTIFSTMMWKDCYNYINELEQELFNTQKELYKCDNGNG